MLNRVVRVVTEKETFEGIFGECDRLVTFFYGRSKLDGVAANNLKTGGYMAASRNGSKSSEVNTVSTRGR